MQPQEVFLQNLPLIERIVTFVARRNRLDLDEREEFASVARLKLIEDDYAVIRQFQGRSSLSTYLTIVIQRLLLDFRIQKWGKWRPSAEAKRLGPVAVTFEELTHRDNLSFDEAVSRIAERFEGVTAEEVQRIQKLLPERSRRPRREANGEEILARTASPQRADDRTLSRERADVARRASDVLQRTYALLDPEDRLILRMRFADGLKVSSMATVLGLDQKRLYRRIEHLLARLRTSLGEAGLTPDEIADLLENGTEGVEIPFLGFRSGNSGQGPSYIDREGTAAGRDSGSVQRWTT
jgi:RNA polymerase sigma factor (sigma-70 family)